MVTINWLECLSNYKDDSNDVVENATSNDSFSAMMAEMQSASDPVTDFIHAYARASLEEKSGLSEEIIPLTISRPELWNIIQQAVAYVVNEPDELTFSATSDHAALCVLSMLLDVSPHQDGQDFILSDDVVKKIADALSCVGTESSEFSKARVCPMLLSHSSLDMPHVEQMSCLINSVLSEKESESELSLTIPLNVRAKRYQSPGKYTESVLRYIPIVLLRETDLTGPVFENIRLALSSEFKSISCVGLSLYGHRDVSAIRFDMLKMTDTLQALMKIHGPLLYRLEARQSDAEVHLYRKNDGLHLHTEPLTKLSHVVYEGQTIRDQYESVFASLNVMSAE